jgi:hypothetical protein
LTTSHLKNLQDFTTGGNLTVDNVWEIKALKTKLNIANTRIDKLESCIKHLARAVEHVTVGTPEGRTFACKVAMEIEKHYLLDGK